MYFEALGGHRLKRGHFGRNEGRPAGKGQALLESTTDNPSPKGGRSVGHGNDRRECPDADKKCDDESRVATRKEIAVFVLHYATNLVNAADDHSHDIANSANDRLKHDTDRIEQGEGSEHDDRVAKREQDSADRGDRR